MVANDPNVIMENGKFRGQVESDISHISATVARLEDKFETFQRTVYGCIEDLKLTAARDGTLTRVMWAAGSSVVAIAASIMITRILG